MWGRKRYVLEAEVHEECTNSRSPKRTCLHIGFKFGQSIAAQRVESHLKR
jgi:hypothetical protein